MIYSKVMSLPSHCRADSGKIFLTINDGDAVDGQNNPYGSVVDVRPGRTADEIHFKFQNRKEGKRLRRSEFNQAKGSELGVDSSTNRLFCLSAKTLIGITENPKSRKRKRVEVPDLEVEKSFSDKLVGIHEIHINNLKAPPPEYSCRGTKDEWTLTLRDRLLRSLSLQTIVPILVDPSEVQSVADFSVENITRYTAFSIGGNHLREAIQGMPSIPQGLDESSSFINTGCQADTNILISRDLPANNLRLSAIIQGYLQCKVYVGLTPAEAVVLGNQHNSKNKHLQLTFQEKIHQARILYLEQKENLRDRLCNRLGLLETKETNKDSLSIIISVARYTDRCFKAAEHLFEMHEAKHGSAKDFPQKIFRLIQGHDEETRFLVLQRATDSSPDVAATWFEQEVTRKHIQETFIAHTKCQEWEEAQQMYPNYTEKLEELVGLPKKQKTAHIKEFSKDALNTKDNLSAGQNIFNIRISITKGKQSLTGEKVTAITIKHTKKILNDILKLTNEELFPEQ